MLVAACVLAAGAGRRMGSSKALLPLAGRTFVETLLASLRAAEIDLRFVVGRSDGRELQSLCDRDGATFLVNPTPDRGMLSSLHVCLDAITGLESDATRVPVEALLVAPVDCPRVQPTTLVALVRTFAATRAPLVVPRFAARRGHPTLFAASVFEELRRAPIEVGARAVVWAHAADRVEVDVDDVAILEDFDTPESILRL